MPLSSLNRVEASKLFESGPKVVKLNRLSPKDVRNPPIFSSLDEALKVIESSERCNAEHEDKPYIMIREVEPLIQKYPHKEFRCFIYNEKLRAISSSYYEGDEDIIDNPDLYKNKIVSYVNKIPLMKRDIVIDIFCYAEKDIVFIIECNRYERAGSELFDWIEDVNTLKYSKEPVFRYLDLFYNKIDL